MQFTEYKFNPAYIAEIVQQRRDALMQNRGEGDLLGFGLTVVAQRLAKDPQRYLDYGPWWWSLKALLRNAGHTVGMDTDTMVEAEYKGTDDVSTLISADEFRTEFLSSRFVGTREHLLNAQRPDWYVLHDNDMEMVSAIARA